jgi:hypothetical protein
LTQAITYQLNKFSNTMELQVQLSEVFIPVHYGHVLHFGRIWHPSVDGDLESVKLQ